MSVSNISNFSFNHLPLQRNGTFTFIPLPRHSYHYNENTISWGLLVTTSKRMGRYADFYNNTADQFGFIVNGLSTILLGKNTLFWIFYEMVWGRNTWITHRDDGNVVVVEASCFHSLLSFKNKNVFKVNTDDLELL